MRRYFLPILSGVFMALSFYPFYFWPLILVALGPLYYFAHQEHRTKKELLTGGFITGLLVALPLYYFTLAHLIPGLGGDFYTSVIRALSIPAVLLQSALFGLMVLAWGSLRGRSSLFNVLVASICYLLVERILFFIFGGYYPDSLAAATVALPAALAAAALGGMPLVSLFAAAVGCAVGELARAWRAGQRRALVELGAACLVCVVLVGLSQTFSHASPRGSLRVSIIQQVPSSRAEHMFGTWEEGDFKNPLLRARIEEAERGSDLVVYPHPPLEASLEEDAEAAIGAWLSNFVSASTSVLFWTTALRDNRLFTEYALWQGGKESLYQKHALYAFSDYTPEWAQAFGVEKSPVPVSPGTSTQPLPVNGFLGGGLICSELHQDGYARAQGARADFLIAAGLDAFFPGELMGEYSLAVARYRAAENGQPVVRANLFGPSALINADGSLEASLPYGKRGILRGALDMKKIPTLYQRTGEWPVYALMFLTIAAALYRRLKSPGSGGRRQL